MSLTKNVFLKLQPRTCGGFEVSLLLLLDRFRVVVGGALVHGEGGDLLVRLTTVVTVVGLARRVDHVVFVEAGVLCEALLTAGHRAHVWLLPWTATHTTERRITTNICLGGW